MTASYNRVNWASGETRHRDVQANYIRMRTEYTKQTSACSHAAMSGPLGGISVTSYSQCTAGCTANANCRSVSYRASPAHCWLFGSTCSNPAAGGGLACTTPWCHYNQMVLHPTCDQSRWCSFDKR